MQNARSFFISTATSARIWAWRLIPSQKLQNMCSSPSPRLGPGSCPRSLYRDDSRCSVPGRSWTRFGTRGWRRCCTSACRRVRSRQGLGMGDRTQLSHRRRGSPLGRSLKRSGSSGQAARTTCISAARCSWRLSTSRSAEVSAEWPNQ